MNNLRLSILDQSSDIRLVKATLRRMRIDKMQYGRNELEEGCKGRTDSRPLENSK